MRAAPPSRQYRPHPRHKTRRHQPHPPGSTTADRTTHRKTETADKPTPNDHDSPTPAHTQTKERDHTHARHSHALNYTHTARAHTASTRAARARTSPAPHPNALLHHTKHAHTTRPHNSRTIDENTSVADVQRSVARDHTLCDPGQRISKKTTSFNLSISIRRGSGIYTPPPRARACAATGWAGYG